MNTVTKWMKDWTAAIRNKEDSLPVVELPDSMRQVIIDAGGDPDTAHFCMGIDAGVEDFSNSIPVTIRYGEPHESTVAKILTDRD